MFSTLLFNVCLEAPTIMSILYCLLGSPLVVIAVIIQLYYQVYWELKTLVLLNKLFFYISWEYFELLSLLFYVLYGGDRRKHL
jgi:hypothetical protein